MIPADIERELEALRDTKPKWEPWKDEAVRRYYGKKPITELARILQACHRTIMFRAKVLGLTP